MSAEEKLEVLRSLAGSFEDIKDFDLRADRDAIDEIEKHVMDNIRLRLESL